MVRLLRRCSEGVGHLTPDKRSIPPFQEDSETTNKITQALKYVGVRVLDHIIVDRTRQEVPGDSRLWKVLPDAILTRKGYQHGVAMPKPPSQTVNGRNLPMRSGHASYRQERGDRRMWSKLRTSRRKHRI